MTLNETHVKREKLVLPASSWWVPSITLLIALLAVATALV
jgi:hypothetical protein